MRALWALLTAFGAGTVAIVCIRLLFPDAMGAMFAAGAAIAAICWLGWYSYGHRDTRDLNRVGDDLYYLGLLFTLVSLIYVLIWLFILNPDEDLERRTYILIGNFGIGLISTVAGIFGRILLQSTADGPLRSPDAPVVPTGDGIEETGSDAPVVPVGDGIGETGSDLMVLRRELRNAANAFSHFSRITLNQAEQTKIHTERLIRDFNEDMTASAKREFDHTAAAWRQVSDAMMPLRRELQEAADAFGHHARTTQRQAEQTKTNTERLFQEFEKQIAQTTKSGLDNTVEAWRDAAQAMESHSTGLLDRIKDQGDASTVRVEDAWRELTERAEALSEIVHHRLDANAQEMSSLLEHMDSANQSLVAFATSIETVERNVRALGETAASAVTGLDERAAEIVNAHNTLAQGAKQYQEVGLQTYQDAVSKFMNATHEPLVGELSAWLTAIKAFTAASQAQQELSERSVEEARRLSEKMSAEVSQWTAATEHMRNSLVAAVEDLTAISAQGLKARRWTWKLHR